MLLLKPKDVAKKLNTPPDKISLLAHDIESACIYTFPKTALGSFLFEEKDVIILKEYHDLIYFFRKKKEALHMLDQQLPFLLEEDELHPKWSKHLYNSKFLP